MFEDFENRSGFWKDLGSNFTINYSGDAPSFLTSGEMWESMDSGTTQTLAAWENGWVLNNNPDGTMTANPKYTSGLPSETIVRVPVGPTNPQSPPNGGGGVVVAFNARSSNDASQDNAAYQSAIETEDEDAPTDDYAHSMYDCKTGDEYIANTEEEHNEYAALGYVHDMNMCNNNENSANAVKAIGYGLGAIALVGLATTGLIVYGVVKVAGKVFGK
jgi:hypothetical protein